MIKKIVSIILFLLFAAFAYLQLNDPDPTKWVIIYGVVAIICLLQVFNIESKKGNLMILVVLAIFSLIYIPGFYEWITTPNKDEIFGEMVYDKPYIEETREFLGLVIAMAGIYVWHRETSKR